VFKVILAILFFLCCVSIGYAVNFDEGDTWVSNRYEKSSTKHPYGDRVKEFIIGERVYEFKKSGRNLYKAYDDETGNFFEAKRKGRGTYGEWEIYDYETGDIWLLKETRRKERE
jgi:hypothetical protein